MNQATNKMIQNPRKIQEITLGIVQRGETHLDTALQGGETLPKYKLSSSWPSIFCDDQGPTRLRGKISREVFIDHLDKATSSTDTELSSDSNGDDLVVTFPRDASFDEYPIDSYTTGTFDTTGTFGTNALVEQDINVVEPVKNGGSSDLVTYTKVDFSRPCNQQQQQQRTFRKIPIGTDGGAFDLDFCCVSVPPGLSDIPGACITIGLSNAVQDLPRLRENQKHLMGVVHCLPHRLNINDWICIRLRHDAIGQGTTRVVLYSATNVDEAPAWRKVSPDDSSFIMIHPLTNQETCLWLKHFCVFCCVEELPSSQCKAAQTDYHLMFHAAFFKSEGLLKMSVFLASDENTEWNGTSPVDQNISTLILKQPVAQVDPDGSKIHVCCSTLRGGWELETWSKDSASCCLNPALLQRRGRTESREFVFKRDANHRTFFGVALTILQEGIEIDKVVINLSLTQLVDAEHDMCSENPPPRSKCTTEKHDTGDPMRHGQRKNAAEILSFPPEVSGQVADPEDTVLKMPSGETGHGQRTRISGVPYSPPEEEADETVPKRPTGETIPLQVNAGGRRFQGEQSGLGCGNVSDRALVPYTSATPIITDGQESPTMLPTVIHALQEANLLSPVQDTVQTRQILPNVNIGMVCYLNNGRQSAESSLGMSTVETLIQTRRTGRIPVTVWKKLVNGLGTERHDMNDWRMFCDDLGYSSSRGMLQRDENPTNKILLALQADERVTLPDDLIATLKKLERWELVEAVRRGYEEAVQDTTPL